MKIKSKVISNSKKFKDLNMNDFEVKIELPHITFEIPGHFALEFELTKKQVKELCESN